MKLATVAAVLALAGSASAFAPSAFAGKGLAVRPAATATALRMADTEGFIGRPFGFEGVVFDPLGLSRPISDIELKRWREVSTGRQPVQLSALRQSNRQRCVAPLSLARHAFGRILRQC
jgi:hypothetical protein